MDIRSYFSSTRKPNSTPKSDPPVKTNTKSLSSTKKGPKRIIESDSEDPESFSKASRKKKKTVKVTPKKRIRRIIDSSDESNEEEKVNQSKSDHVQEKRSRQPARFQISDSSSEERSPKKQKLIQQHKGSAAVKSKTITQTKLSNLQVTSKFFKETSATAVFGDEPVKRSDKKLKEIKEKLNHIKSKTDVKMDDDADFEAALQQLDEVGDNWVDWEEIKEVETAATNSKTTNATKMDEKFCKNKKYTANDKNDLLKTAISNNAMNEKVPRDEKTESLPDSLSSGYCSADSSTHLEQSSDSQGVDEMDEILTMQMKFVTKKMSPPAVKVKQKPVKNTEQKKVLEINDKVNRSSNTVEKLKKNTSESSYVNIKISPGKSATETISDNFSLWVEKYKPLSSKKIIGQQGDKSNVNKLTSWLNNWYKNNSRPKKAAFVPSGWNKDPTGACFKAALLSGPPGVGKTTSVTLVCQELGFDMVEFNASDTRSKKLLQEEVAELLGSTSLLPFFSNKKTKDSGYTKKHVLVMDEVDGMAGNEDRGGVQELIQLIKTTKVPIICMCNDRNHPKIRSLVNYCFDLRFSRPRIEQIKGYMRTVCFKEKLNVTAEALTNIITSANNDVRLVLNHLSMLAADKQSTDLEAAKKYVKLNAWDVLRKVFSKEEHKNMSIHEKCDLFFFDYSIAPLFVQENYLTVKPLNVDAQSRSKKMELYARAADCISIGDRVDVQIREKNAWSLLPTQAIFASYAPGEILEGYCTAQINFPSWLGKYSKQNKVNRLLQELQIHTRFKISGTKESINLDYAPHLKNRITEPLVKHGLDGVSTALKMLHQYDLLKDDLESLIEICQWPNNPNPMTGLDSKVKAAFTRAYNKNPPVPPYSLSAPVKRGRGSVVDEIPGEDEDNESGDSDDEGDAMIITKKLQPAKKIDTTVPSTSKGKTKSGTESKRSRKK